ncbi:MAG: RDD family protein [Persicimonas sp.]
MNQPNPYAAPSSVIDDQPRFDQDPWAAAPLATRGSRLVAFLIDWASGLVVALPAMLGLMAFGGGSTDNDTFLMLGVGISIVLLMGLAGYNLYRLHENGQTIGKQIMGIKIVRSDRTTPASLLRIIFLRSFLIGLASQIPIIGLFIALGDPLFIFSEDQQCLHDMLADTNVIVDNPASGGGVSSDFDAGPSSGPGLYGDDYFGSTGTDGSSGAGQFGPGGGSGGSSGPSNDNVAW